MENILSEILDILKRLEEKVDKLSNKENHVKKINMTEIREYISELKKTAKKESKEYIILVSNEIHSAMNLNSKMPMVCNAMYQSMKTGDEVLFQTKSGYSSTLKIKYYLK